MKLKKIISALCAALMFTGCAESIGEIIENDANIGKNAPAVNGTIGDINAINEEAAKTETEFESEEDKAEKAAKERLDKLNKKADELLSEMTAEEKVGQVILARMPSSPADEMAAYQHSPPKSPKPQRYPPFSPLTKRAEQLSESAHIHSTVTSRSHLPSSFTAVAARSFLKWTPRKRQGSSHQWA